MAIRTLIATALMASACAAHADVIPSSNGAGVVSGSNSEVLVQALYQKVSASVGSDMKVSLKQGIDGVYVTGLSAAKAAALAGDGMSVIATPNGYKIVDTSGASVSNNATVGGGANSSIGSGAPAGNPTASLSTPSATPGATPSGTQNATPAVAPPGLDNLTGNGNTAVDTGINVGVDAGNGNGSGNGAGTGSGQQAAEVPEPSSIALMLAGMLGVAGLGRRRAR